MEICSGITKGTVKALNAKDSYTRRVCKVA